MKKTHALTAVLGTLLLSSSFAAVAESQYPEEFKPSVIYRDADLIAKHNKPIETAIPSPSQKTPSAAPSKVLGQPDQPVTADYLVYGVAAALLGFVAWSARRKA